MNEVGFVRRVAPAVLLAAAGGLMLYLLPTGADADTSASEDVGFPDSTGASSAASAGAASSAPGSAQPAAPSSGQPASTASAKRVIKGDRVDFKFGTVQVKILLDGTTIANIATITAPGGGYQQWTDRAIPEMKAKILSAQSTRVAAASGATYTSKAYAKSVQSALDKA